MSIRFENFQTNHIWSVACVPIQIELILKQFLWLFDWHQMSRMNYQWKKLQQYSMTYVDKKFIRKWLWSLILLKFLFLQRSISQLRINFSNKLNTSIGVEWMDLISSTKIQSKSNRSDIKVCDWPLEKQNPKETGSTAEMLSITNWIA